MKRTSLALLLSLGSPLAFAQVAAPRPAKTAAANPAYFQRIDQLLQEYTAASRGRGTIGKVMPDGTVLYRDDRRVPGAIALVMRDGKVVYRKAFGVNDVGFQTPLQADAIVRIASQTKAVTSVGLMLLYDEGKFQLDDPISKYLPAFRNPKVLATFNEKDSTYTTVPAKGEITIRQLFTHTSGISYPVIGTKEARAIYAKARIPSGIGTPGGSLAASMDALGALPLVHQPGERFTYGLSVDVLGRLIEVLSGQSLDQFLRTRLFEPLNMRDTYFYLPAAKHARLAELWTEDANKKTAFLQMLLNNGTYNGHHLLKPATVARITQNQIGAVMQGDHKFGLGFSLTTAESAAKQPFGPSEGSYEWGGIFGTTYWVDPRQKIVALIYTQKYPNSTGGDLAGKFKTAVYETFGPQPNK